MTGQWETTSLNSLIPEWHKSQRTWLRVMGRDLAKDKIISLAFPINFPSQIFEWPLLYLNFYFFHPKFLMTLFSNFIIGTVLWLRKYAVYIQCFQYIYIYSVSQILVGRDHGSPQPQTPQPLKSPPMLRAEKNSSSSSLKDRLKFFGVGRSCWLVWSYALQHTKLSTQHHIIAAQSIDT